MPKSGFTKRLGETMETDVVSAVVGGAATVLGALIVGVAGGLITQRLSRERDRQDKESQWRQHAIELTKLDLERKTKARESGASQPLRPSILDFLANYRDLQELGASSPAQLYLKIERSRIATSGAANEAEGAERPNNEMQRTGLGTAEPRR